MAQRVTGKIARKKKCKTRRRNFRNGGLVLLKAKIHQNHWPVACTIETFANKHGVAQTVRLNIGSANKAQIELVQPIAKTVLLVQDDSLTGSQGLYKN